MKFSIITNVFLVEIIIYNINSLFSSNEVCKGRENDINRLNIGSKLCSFLIYVRPLVDPEEGRAYTSNHT